MLLKPVKSKVNLGYQYSANDTDGSNFKIDGSHALNVRTETLITGPFWLALQGIFTWEDYNGFVAGFVTPPGRTDQFLQKYLAELLWVIHEKITVDFFVSHELFETNQVQFDSDRTKAGAGATYRF